MNNSDYNSFTKEIKKVSNTRTHKITNSYGMAEYFSYYRKVKPILKKYTITSTQFRQVINSINLEFYKLLTEGESVQFPCRMGKLELIEYTNYPKIDKNGELKFNVPIDWQATLNLWYEDEEAKNNKLLIKTNRRNFTKFLYTKVRAVFKNKCFFKYAPNRELRREVNRKYENKEITLHTL